MQYALKLQRIKYRQHNLLLLLLFAMFGVNQLLTPNNVIVYQVFMILLA